jgi:SPP1 gp7 family putative phage head morphogenesis protein
VAGIIMPLSARTDYNFLNTRYIASLDTQSRINKLLDKQITKLLKSNSKVFDPLYKTILKCKSPAELNKLKPSDLPENKDLQYLLTRILQYSDFYGRYTASTKSAPSASSNSSRFTIHDSRLTLDIDYDMTYNEAAEWFESLKVIYAPDFYDELRKNAGNSWTISYITQTETLNKCQKYITAALQGKTKINPDEMKEAIADFAVRNGDAPLTPWHLGTIIRTNLQSAFSKGRYIEQRKSDNPYWQYLATLDGRETELCSSLDGKVFRKQDAFWGHYYPPNHFNCRSTVVTLDEDTLKEEGLEVEHSGNDFLKRLRKLNPDIAKRLYPGLGFRTSPRRGISKWITKKAAALKTPIKEYATPVFSTVDEAAQYLNNKFNLQGISYSKCKNLDLIQEVATALDDLSRFGVTLDYIKFTNTSGAGLASHNLQYNRNHKVYTLKVNVRSFEGLSRDQINKYIHRMHVKEWLAGSRYSDVIAHEIAHHLTYQWMSYDDIVGSKKFLNSSPSEKLPFISDYAQTTNIEYIAELFVYYLKGNQISKEQKNLLKNYLRLKV